MKARVCRAACGTTLVVLLALAACGNDEVREPSPKAAPNGFSVVVIGDSIPYNAPYDCPDCTAFADSYGAALEEQVGRSVTVENLSRHDGAMTHDIHEQLETGVLDEPLSKADVVLLSVGFNDQPPYAGSGQPCAGPVEPLDAALTTVRKTTRACVDDVTADLRTTLTTVLDRVRERAPDAALGTLVPYNSWTGWSPLVALPKPQRDHIEGLVTHALDEWRTALCAESEAVDATCVDVYRAFNGDRGLLAATPLLADDHTHPNQRGNDVIRDLLVEAQLVG
jgi:lysophospholipase L1-like esterase